LVKASTHGWRSRRQLHPDLRMDSQLGQAGHERHAACYKVGTLRRSEAAPRRDLIDQDPQLCAQVMRGDRCHERYTRTLERGQQALECL
jgi:hypothetical protein